MNTRNKTYNKVSLPNTILKPLLYFDENLNRDNKLIQYNYYKYESINELDDYGNKTIVIGYCSFGFQYRTIYTEIWLNTLTNIEIQMIGDKYGLRCNRKTKNKYNSYINNIIQIYDENQMKHVSQFADILFYMDSKIINKFYDDMYPYHSSIINQLKQKINHHRRFQPYPIKVDLFNQNKIQHISIDSIDCPVCMDDFNQLNNICTDCNHNICVNCFIQIASYARNNMKSCMKCPLCRSAITGITLDKCNKSDITRFCSNQLYYKQIKEEQQMKLKYGREIDAENERIRGNERNDAYIQKIIKISYFIINILKAVIWVLFILFMYIFIGVLVSNK